MHLIVNSQNSIPKNTQARCISELTNAYLYEKDHNDKLTAITKAFKSIRSYRKFGVDDLTAASKISHDFYQKSKKLRRMKISSMKKMPRPIKRPRVTINVVVFI